MSTVKSKSTKAVAVTSKASATAEHPIEKEAIKKTPSKPSPAKKTKAADIQPIVEPIEHDVITAVEKRDKIKIVKHSFPFPEQDYLKVVELKKICLAEGILVKKNELIRVGLNLLLTLSLAEIKQAVDKLDKI